MSEISVVNLVKRYAADTVLDGVSFDLAPGERVGLIGKNGSGKTTLFRLITGQESPSSDTSRITVRKGAKICCLDQLPEYPRDTTVRRVLHQPYLELIALQNRIETLEGTLRDASPADAPEILHRYGTMREEFENRGGYEMDEKIKWVCLGLKIGIDLLEKPFMRLSGGEKTRVALAEILLQDPDIVLLDEPTNHLDMQSIEWLEDSLGKFAGSALIVSHDRYFLDRTINRLLVLKNGKTKAYTCNYTNYALETETRRKTALNEYNKIDKEIRRLTSELRKNIARNRRSHSPFLATRNRELAKELAALNKIKKPKSDRSINLRFTAVKKSSRTVLRLTNVYKSYASKKVLQGIDLHVKYRDKLAIVGDNGSGKTTLLKLMLEQLSPGLGTQADSGDVYVGQGIKAGYIDQALSFPDTKASVLHTFMAEVDCSIGRARSALAGFLFYEADVDKPIKLLSGGEKTRLRLCLIMQKEINTLVLDEPTNHLDIESRELLEEVLRQFSGSIIFVSHDRYLINKIASRIGEIADGNLTVYEGDYSRLIQEKGKSVALKKEPTDTQRSARDSFLLAKKRRNEQIVKDRRAAAIETEIESMEEQVSDIETAMMACATDHEKLHQLQTEKDSLDQRIHALFEEWEMLRH